MQALTQAQKNKIAPISVFFLLYISRIVVSLTSSQLVTAGKIRTQILISIFISAFVTMIIAIPAALCSVKHKNPFDIKWLSAFYSVYFVFLAAVNISRFSYFASTTLNPNSQAWIFSVIVTVCALYAACLGIESLARFSAFGFFLLVIAIAAAIICNAGNFDRLNYYPLLSGDTENIFQNVIYMTSSSSESVIFLCLSKRVNGSGVKPLFISIAAVFLTIFALFASVIGVLGDAASVNSFPLYTLFQLAKIGLLERMDVFYISFWIFGIFIKSVLLIYCAGSSLTVVKKITPPVRYSFCAAAALCLSVYFTEFLPVSNVRASVYILPYAVFCVAVPVLTLIFKKRNYGDELVEKF